MEDDVKSIDQQAAEWFFLLRENPQDDALRDRFEAWLDAEPLHARGWVSVSEMFDAIGETSPELEHRWPTPSRPAAIGKSRRWRRIWSGISPSHGWRLGTAAAAAALAIWFAPTVLLHIRSDHVTGTGEISSVRLVDGSMVRLGPQSAIAVDYNGSERVVTLLAGQAWFDVRRNPARPFHVLAGKVETLVLGTSFDVRRIGAGTEVSVQEGHVRVIDRDISPILTRDLTAGRWLSIAADHSIAQGMRSPSLTGLWRDGSIVARNRTIADIVEEIRPWYRGHILLLNAELGRRKVDGVYDGHDPTGALKAVVGHAGGQVRSITPWLLVLS